MKTAALLALLATTPWQYGNMTRCENDVRVTLVGGRLIEHGPGSFNIYQRDYFVKDANGNKFVYPERQVIRLECR